MATYLQLCQKLARESGTVQGTQPTSVTSQSGRLLKIVNWVADSWTDIQNLHSSWRWLRGELPSGCVTASGTARYTSSAWSITRFGEWITWPHSLSIYKSATGVSDEGEISEITFDEWWELYNRGSQTNNRPVHAAISPANEFCFGPIPDAVYVLKGFYRKTPQTLSANADEPECSSQFHDIIVWKALLTMIGHDEAPRDIEGRTLRLYNEYLSALERDSLPRIGYGGPLA